jgi:hypothetical protein
LNRERVIAEIETLEDALKVEQMIRTGYCDPIDENILQWIAVEEDLANSYHKIADRSQSQELKKTLDGFEQESRRNLTLLQNMSKSVEEFEKARIRRERSIEGLIQGK